LCRFALYNTFLLVPVGMSRALGHKPLRLDENDEDEVRDGAVHKKTEEVMTNRQP
jgi:hypothetical protein